MHRHLLHRFRMNSFIISFIQRLELGHGWVICAIRVELSNIFLQNKINIDKIRYEYGGCIYAGWVISCIELLVCPLVWYYRGFSEERQEKKLEKDDKDTEYDKLLEELNAGGLDLTRVSKKLTPYGPMWFLIWETFILKNCCGRTTCNSLMAFIQIITWSKFKEIEIV